MIFVRNSTLPCISLSFLFKKCALYIFYMQMNPLVRDPPPPRYNGGDRQSRLESRLLSTFYSMNDDENAY